MNRRKLLSAMIGSIVAAKAAPVSALISSNGTSTAAPDISPLFTGELGSIDEFRLITHEAVKQWSLYGTGLPKNTWGEDCFKLFVPPSRYRQIQESHPDLAELYYRPLEDIPFKKKPTNYKTLIDGKPYELWVG